MPCSPCLPGPADDDDPVLFTQPNTAHSHKSLSQVLCYLHVHAVYTQIYAQHRVLSTCTLHNIAGHFDHAEPTSACFPRSTKFWSDLFRKLRADCAVLCFYVTHLCRKHIPESYYCFRPLPWPALFHLSRPPACPPACPPAHTKPLLTQGTRDLYHTFHALSPAPLGSDGGRGIEDATLPLVLTLSREDESGTLHPCLPFQSGIAPQPVPQLVPQPTSSAVARHVPHPTLPV